MELQCNWIYILESWSNLLWTRASHDQVVLAICSGIESSKSFLSPWPVHSNQSQPIPICTYHVRNPREQIVREQCTHPFVREREREREREPMFLGIKVMKGWLSCFNIYTFFYHRRTYILVFSVELFLFSPKHVDNKC